MRMWAVDTPKLCMRHLLAEHAEMHMFANAINSGRNIEGFIRKGLVDTGKIKERHDLLAKELIFRQGVLKKNHLSPLEFDPPYIEGFVDPLVSEMELRSRCKYCMERMG